MTNEEFAKLCCKEIFNSRIPLLYDKNILNVMEKHNLRLIPVPKNPHRHFDLAVEAYGDTTIKWQVKDSYFNKWVDYTSTPNFFKECEYRKKPKTIRFRNYKYTDKNGEAKIGIATIDDSYFTVPPIAHEWIGDWKEVEI